MVEEIQRLITAGRFFEAHNLAKDYCVEHPDDMRALQLCGLAMSKSGARMAAINFLEPILEGNINDVETAGILGGVYKEQFKMTAESAYARKSHETYLANFEETRNYYTGINAATMSQILGRGKSAREVAQQVVELASKEDNFWANATVGEAYLLLRDPVKAREYYSKAAALGDSQYGNMGSVYAQLLILKHYIIVPESIIEQFAPPRIAIFAGHMVDHNRNSPRFPSSISEEVKADIKKVLVEKNIRIGFSSLACGSDILFVEALIELGGEVNIYIPFNRDDFLETSVSFAGDDWVNRFKAIESSHEFRYISKSKYNNNNLLFQFLGQVMIGSAIMRASLFHSTPYLVTVASIHDQSMKPGGTNSMRSMWPYEHNFINISPHEYLDEAEIDGSSSESPDNSEQPIINTSQKTIQFFALATLGEGQEHLQDKINEVISRVKAEFIEFPGSRRSGIADAGIFAFYTKAHYAMDFSLRLLEWSNQAGIDVKIALEAALMERGRDPRAVIEETSNLKSLAFNDACYATMQFAAALSTEQPGRYDFHHVGIIQMGVTDEGQEIYKIDQKVETALS